MLCNDKLKNESSHNPTNDNMFSFLSCLSKAYSFRMKQHDNFLRDLNTKTKITLPV